MELSELKLTARRFGLLTKMNIHTVEDLLKTYPFRYEDIQAIPFEKWEVNEMVAVEGLIASKPTLIRLGKNRSMVKFRIIAWNEEIEVSLFNRPWISQFQFGNPITLFVQYQGNNKLGASNYN